MADDDVLSDLADARREHEIDLVVLASLPTEDLTAVDQWHEQADPVTDEVEHDDTVPKLTDEEWAYVIEVSG